MLAATKSGPTAAQALCKEGNSFLQASKYPEALASFEKALTYMPNSIDALRGKGVALWKSGKLPEAVTSFDKVLKLDQNNVPALVSKGSVLKEMSEFLAERSKALAKESAACLARAQELKRRLPKPLK